MNFRAHLTLDVEPGEAEFTWVAVDAVSRVPASKFINKVNELIGYPNFKDLNPEHGTVVLMTYTFEDGFQAAAFITAPEFFAERYDRGILVSRGLQLKSRHSGKKMSDVRKVELVFPVSTEEVHALEA